MRPLTARLALGVGLLSGAARGEGARRDTARADALFAEGKGAMRRGELEAACARFDESERLDPAPGTLRWLSECEESRGRFAAAHRHLREAIDMRPDPDLLRLCREQMAALGRRVPTITVRVPSSLGPGSTLLLDSVAVPAAERGKPLRVDPGEHRLELVRPGEPVRAKTVSVAVGGAARASFDEPGDGEPGGAGAGRSVGALAALGVGAAGLGVAAVTGLHLSSVRSEIAACRPRCPDDARSDGAKARGLVPLYYAGWAVGAAGIGLGAYLLLSAPSDPAPAAALGLRIGPGSVLLEGAF